MYQRNRLMLVDVSFGFVGFDEKRVDVFSMEWYATYIPP